MDDRRFDDLAKGLSAETTRRRVLATGAGAVAALVAALGWQSAAAQEAADVGAEDLDDCNRRCYRRCRNRGLSRRRCRRLCCERDDDGDD